MTILNDDCPAGLQGALDLWRDGLGWFVHQDNKVPVFLAEIELFEGGNLRVYFKTESIRFGLCLADSFIGWIEAGHIPPLLRKKDRVPPLSHADVERPSWFSLPRHFHKKCIGLAREDVTVLSTIRRVVLARLGERNRT